MSWTQPYPLLRNTQMCPLCDAPKEIGLARCRPCFRRTMMSVNKQVKDCAELTLITAEAMLARTMPRSVGLGRPF